MLACLYQGLWQIAPPLLKRYLKKRAKKSPAYALNWGERFGTPMVNPVQHPIWIHAVSVGETRAAEPLIQALKQQYPNQPLLITQMTPTGRATAQALYPDAQCRYLPYDKPSYVAQFLQEHQPIFGIIMETEIWPNLLKQAKQQNIPMFLANARLSEKSLQGYLKAKSLIAPALNTLTASFTQSLDDQERLSQLSHCPQWITGNTKYDITPPQAMHDLANAFRQRIGQRKVIVCGSTRMDKHGLDEAELLLQAWQQNTANNALLVIVPRHPERFDLTASLAKKMGFTVQKRSDNQAIDLATEIWIGDSMGELFAYYLLADIVFVGGSLVNTGCQNIIEPMSCYKPTVFGGSTYNFSKVCSDALSEHAAMQVHNANEWLNTTQMLLNDAQQCQSYAKNAKEFVAIHQGASQKIARHIQELT